MADTQAKSRIVQFSSGKVQGRRFTFDGKAVDAFQGIPFAKPPVGELRFKKPEPPTQWEGVKEVTDFGPHSIQADVTVGSWKTAETSEDCLVLNVFTPTWEPPPGGFPVMVYIHGGAFIMDGARTYGDRGKCEWLCTKDVVVVSSQYRLGYLGFWTTGDESHCPDNLAFWDQTASLRWVQANIEAFGGNKNNVTIFGQSAGGASVDFLHLSPHSTNLFHKVIPIAGNAQAPWALREGMVRVCEKRAKKMGVEGWTDAADLMRKLRELPAEKFGGNMFEMDVEHRWQVEVSPVINCEFLPGSIAELRAKATPKPLMTGVGEHESLLFIMMETTWSVEEIKDLVKHLPSGASQEEKDAWIRRFIDLSMENDPKTVAKALSAMHSEFFLNASTLSLAQETVKANPDQPVYLYSFNYFNPDSYGPAKDLLPFLAATHCTELAYLFGKGIIEPFEFNENDRKMADIFSRAYTNFAKYGDPNGTGGNGLPVHWDPVTRDHPERNLIFDLQPTQKETFFDGNSAALLAMQEKPKKSSL